MSDRSQSRSWLRALLVGSGVAAAAMPAWLEVRAREAVRDAWARCRDGRNECGSLHAVDVDITGVRLSDAARDVGPRRIAARTITVGPSLRGIVVHAGGVTIADRPVPPVIERAAPPVAGPTKPRARAVPSTFGIPVTIALDDPMRVAGPRGASLVVRDAVAHLDGDGGMAIAARADLFHAAVPHAIDMSVRAATHGDLEHWRGEGSIRVAPETAPLRVDAMLDPAGGSVTLQGDHGGWMTITPGERGGLRVHADAFALDGIAAALPDRPAIANALRAATVTGDLGVHLGAHPRVHVDGITIDGVVIDDRRITRAPLVLTDLHVAGDLGKTKGGAFVDVMLARAEVALHVAGSIDARGWTLDVELPEHDCQSVLMALPPAMRDTLGGLQLAGQLSAHARLSIDRAALATARAWIAEHPDEPPPPPGTLDLDLPVLTACTVTADPPAIDLVGLLGPYRHRLRSGARVRERTLSEGASEFVPLASVQTIADAFVVLEDRRFFAHDGFDRGQMENALWHNIVRGGVYRGASTISQQTARNLWLGVDRSLARKLQEALLTTRLEATVPKRRILELYVNLIELGPDVHGVEAASRWWFDKPASALTIREAVHLAALAPAPARFARRFASGQLDAEWNAMLDAHIRRMHRAGKIDKIQTTTALRQRLKITAHPELDPDRADRP